VRSRKPMPDADRDAYMNGIKALLNVRPRIGPGDDKEQPRMVRLDKAALNVFENFAQWVEDRQGDGGEFAGLQDFTGKLPGAALRIAALCKVAEVIGSGASLSSLSSSSLRGEIEIVIDRKTIEPVIELCKS